MGNLFAYTHTSHETLQARCTYVSNLPITERCDFIIKLDCDDNSNLIRYHELVFCDIPADKHYIYYGVIVLMFIFFLLSFFYLAVTVDQFFCPAIGVISDILHLSENVSGVTLLAIGNGLPDIIASMISSSSGETILMYNQLLAGSMFVACLIGGMIAYVRPFHFEVFPFIRDMFFTIITVSFIVYLNNKRIPAYGIFIFLGIYLCYIFIAVGYFYYEKRIEILNKKEEEYVDWTELRRPCIVNEEDIQQIILKIRNKYINLNPEEIEKERETYCKEFWNDIKAFTEEEWLVMNYLQRFLIILQSPLIMVLRLIIPNVCFASPRNGWCKLLNSINITLFPLFIGVTFNLNIYVYDIHLFIILSCIGFVCGLIVILTSNKNVPPPYHFIFAFLNLIGSVLVIYMIVNEIVAIISLFGTILKIESQVLVITILAWGNGLGDAITNVSLAKRGFQRMAFSGCLAGPITTMCLSFVVSLASTGTEIIHIESGSMGPVCALFILVFLAYSLLFMLLTNFKARKSYGFFLMSIYVEFLVFCVLTELQIIHPIGSDQEFNINIKK